MPRFRSLIAAAIVAVTALPAIAQGPLTVTFPPGTPLQRSIAMLREQHGLSIVCGVPIGAEPVDASFRGVTARDAATALLTASGYGYRILDGGIVVVFQAPATRGPALPDPVPLGDSAAPASTTRPGGAVIGTPATEVAAAETGSVKPGINESFLSESLDVGGYVQRFEGESREVFVHRGRIAAAVGLEPGMAIADVGAGTGIYMEPFAKKVGAAGKVFAVDLAPKFVAHLQELADRRGFDQVQVVQCTENSVELPPDSVDRVFICDTYHHFEYPRGTMTSILRALKPGGELIVVDFERIPNVSREWTLNHVRAGRDEVCSEIASFGFEFREFVAIEGLRENYVVRFAKPKG